MNNLKSWSHIILVLLFWHLSYPSIAQIHQIDYNRTSLTKSDGLSQNDVLDIFQDSYGFVWIATNDGLNRYDGIEVKLFPKGELGLESSLVLSICEDQSRNLWIGTADKGLYYYLRNENRFVHISQMSNDSLITNLETIRYAMIGADNELWIYSRLENGFIRLDYTLETLQITNYSIFPIDKLTKARCTGIELINNQVYAYTNWGLLRYDEQEQQMVRLPDFDYTIRDIELHHNKLYVATLVGLFRYDLESGKKEQVISHLESLFKISWEGDSLYIATKDGLYVTHYEVETDQFSEEYQIDSYPNFNTNKLIQIETGGIWVGLDKESIRIYQHNTKPFKLINGFGNNHVVSLCINNNQQMWVGTEGSGYFLFDKKEPNNRPNYMDGSTINAITYAPHTAMYYIATNNGIYKHRNGGNERLVSPISTTKSMVADGKYLWIACYSEGLKRIDLDSEQIYSLTPSNSALKCDIIRCVLVDNDGKLWVSTSKGLFVIEADDKTSKQPTLTEVQPEVCGSRYIVPIYQSHTGDIWCGTLGDGLFRLIKEKQGGYSVEWYNTNNQLPNNTVKAITEDRNGVIWVSLNSGLCAIDITQKNLTSYDMNNGLQDSEFHDVSAGVTTNNKLLFGGVKGLTMFDPSAIHVDYTQSTPRLTNFEIFNKSVLDIAEREQIVPLALEATKKITLEHNQNSFTFSFSSFNYTGAKRHQYLYKLEGFDREWQVAKANRNEASYTNMSYGDYRFVVRCKNEDGVLNPNEMSIDLKINPPFWLTWYAILLYLIVGTLVLVGLIRYYQKRLIRLNAVQLAKLEKQKVEELLDVRTNFFTNVSHEFRTPLTLILSPLQQLMADPEIMADPEWRKHLKTMSYNGESLMRLANDFLNFSKRESRALKLELQLGEFDQLIKELSKHLTYMAKSKGVTLNYVPSNGGAIDFYFDAAHIEQIVYNLTSNAIKHTTTGGEVTLMVSDSDTHVTLTVTDSGAGIPLEIQPHIFQRFVSRDSSASSGSSSIGIGLSLTKDLVELHNGTITFHSEVEVGTTFTIVLPKYCGDSLTQIEQRSTKNESIELSPTVAAKKNESVVTHTTEHDTERDVVLVVDDNKQLVGLLYSLLNHKYKVISTTDSIEALSMAQSFIPDLIISDVMMPQMDGYELCEKIKSHENTSHIPVILLTAKNSTEDMATGYRHKADGYRTKPFNNDVLLEQVHSLLENRRTLANRIKQNETAFEVEQIGISSDADKQMVQRFVSFVEENISNPNLLVGDVCKAVGLTQVVLNKKLKSLFNMTANSMIRNIRLKRAAELLRTGRYTVSSITYDVGFNDLRHFRESFLKEYGMFPQAYKKKYNEGVEFDEE